MKKQIVILLILVSWVVSGFAVTIKIGSIAPSRSPWDKALKKLGIEWKKITNGQVKLKIYPGGIAGNEADVIRKMRIGILGGGVFTNRGLAKIYSDVNLLNVPFLITSETKLDYALKYLKPIFEEGLVKKGFKLIAWSMAGWIHIFSKNPVNHPDDLKKHKLSFATGEPELEQAWKKSGYHVVPNDLKDMMMALQSGMVNSFYLTPLIAASAQYFAFAPNMCSLKIAPVVGGIVLSSKIWKRIPEKYRADMIKAMNKIEDELNVERVKLSREALDTMKEHKLIINQVTKVQKKAWFDAAERGMDEIIGKVFSRELYEGLVSHLKGFKEEQKN